MPYIIQVNLADNASSTDWQAVSSDYIAWGHSPMIFDSEADASLELAKILASGPDADVCTDADAWRILEIPHCVECGDGLANQCRSKRATLAKGVMAWASGSCRADVELVSRSAGYAVAGSAMRLDGAAWGFIIHRSDGTTGGQWFKSEEEARAMFASKVPA